MTRDVTWPSGPIERAEISFGEFAGEMQRLGIDHLGVGRRVHLEGQRRADDRREDDAHRGDGDRSPFELGLDHLMLGLDRHQPTMPRGTNTSA
jgi:hypothetical protein